MRNSKAFWSWREGNEQTGRAVMGAHARHVRWQSRPPLWNGPHRLSVHSPCFSRKCNSLRVNSALQSKSSQSLFFAALACLARAWRTASLNWSRRTCSASGISWPGPWSARKVAWLSKSSPAPHFSSRCALIANPARRAFFTTLPTGRHHRMICGNLRPRPKFSTFSIACIETSVCWIGIINYFQI